MRIPLIPVIIWIIINLAIDLYIYRVLKSRLPRNTFWRRLHLCLSVLLLAVIIVALALPIRSGNDSTLLTVNWLLFIYLTAYVPKYLYFLFDIISRIPRLLGFHRWKWLGRTGAVISIVMFFAFWWGTLINRFNIDVREVTVKIPGLPSQFDGYRIVQFSDFHVGSYGSNDSFVRDVVATVNALHPDAIFFTGDIVNRYTHELPPFVPAMKELYAPDGVLAILGNHDYGDYHSWPSPGAKQQNMEELYALFEKAGWKLLRNETSWLVRGNDSIAVIGVENIGDPPFPVYGSLSKAYPTIDDDKIKILLSHNPAHWVDSIADHPAVNVPLTLSGHTHAMQMSVGRISPASLRYKTWGGLYHDTDGIHQLYVNIGLGTVGLPMRLGATPEITLITLKPNS
ncbi:MAG: metallophosphoesterase [Muribaculaceae bacterium]|nr:metallophosphoesterase [Muribaculaceae bacterium]